MKPVGYREMPQKIGFGESTPGEGSSTRQMLAASPDYSRDHTNPKRKQEDRNDLSSLANPADILHTSSKSRLVNNPR